MNSRIKKAKKFTDKLLEMSYGTKNAIYFPYNFDWFLHNNKYEMLNQPWFSGMAQGQALSAFVRLFKFTNEKKYLNIAGQIFNTFLYTQNLNSDPWISIIDEDRYFWIEEYPCEPPTHVLNGFLHSIFGLYDYYLLTNDKQCKKLLNCSLTTTYYYIDKYRNINNLSYYCLKHKSQYEKYHLIHIKQLLTLFKITGENRFKNYANHFQNDYQNYKRSNN